MLTLGRVTIYTRAWPFVVKRRFWSRRFTRFSNCWRCGVHIPFSHRGLFIQVSKGA